MASMEIGKLYEIYSTDDECFSVGYLLYQNDDICIFKSFDNQGREAGIYAFKKKIISTCLEGTEYLAKMKLYIDYWNDKEIKTLSMNDLDGEISIRNILEYIISSKKIATIMINSDDDMYTGFVSESDAVSVAMECVDISNAKVYDKIKINVGDICFIEFNSVDNDVLLYAYRNLNGKHDCCK